MDGNPVRYIGAYGDKILIDGTLGGIVVWDGNGLDTLPDTGARSSVEKDSLLYVGGGSYETIAYSPGAAVWDGETWQGLGNGVAGIPGITPQVTAMIFYQDQLIAGGNNFRDSLGQEFDMKYFNGQSWQALPGWANGGATEITDFEIFQGELYVAGQFFETRGALGNCIVRWDGTRWEKCGSGVQEGFINDMEVLDGKLYAAGSFQEIGGVPALNIARWDGTRWCRFSEDSLPGPFSRLAVLNDTLFASRGYITMYGDTVGHVIKWLGDSGSEVCGPDYLTSLTEASEWEDLRVYPNPVSDLLWIEGNRPEPVCMSVTDMQGQVLLSQEMPLPARLNLTALPTGIYLLHIESRGHVRTEKLLKM